MATDRLITFCARRIDRAVGAKEERARCSQLLPTAATVIHVSGALIRKTCKIYSARHLNRTRYLGRLAALFSKPRGIRLSGVSEAKIPARVQAEIDKREEAAERLIGWVQLALVTVFGTLYFASPRAQGAIDTSFTPWALSLYFAFTLFRVWLSYRIVLPTWYLVISILVDVSLLCALIFSFHIQYHQPPAFYLKVPTMLYFFIFISVRALRFDPRFVLLTGLASVAGWLTLVGYALLSDMGEMYITRNFVDYLNSNSILIGAEIDKVVALLGVTLVLSLALYRARSVLTDAIRSHTAAADLRQFFSPAVAETITGHDSLPMVGRCEAREVSILIVDLRSFTKTAAGLPPDVVMKVLGIYQNAAVAEIERHGGQIDKFMGDGILATFGAVQESKSHAADALRAAVGVVEAVQAIEPDIRAAGWMGLFRPGVAVASGVVTVGVVGARNRLEFTVIGTPVNLAAKLEDANKIEGTKILTDVQTYDLAVIQGYGGPAPEHRSGRHIQGFSGPLDLVVLA
jgi:adenylate cyclase